MARPRQLCFEETLKFWSHVGPRTCSIKMSHSANNALMMINAKDMFPWQQHTINIIVLLLVSATTFSQNALWLKLNKA